MKITSFALKQYSVAGMWIGAIQSQFNNTQSYVSMVQFLLITVVAYHTTLRDTILRYIPWMNFWIFLLVGAALFLLVMLIDYKIVVPSRVNYSNYQAYKHVNPVKEDLKKIKTDMKEVVTRLKRIEKMVVNEYSKKGSG